MWCYCVDLHCFHSDQPAYSTTVFRWWKKRGLQQNNVVVYVLPDENILNAHSFDFICFFKINTYCSVFVLWLQLLIFPFTFVTVVNNSTQLYYCLYGATEIIICQTVAIVWCAPICKSWRTCVESSWLLTVTLHASICHMHRVIYLE